MTARDRRAVASWLFIVAGLVFAMVLLGGATRLTGSGLSMTEWRPLTGWLPPLSPEAWREAFARYRETPEFRLLNPEMALDGFKTIYGFEYAHRLMGRVIGLAFLAPLVVFLARRRIEGRLARRLVGILVLGGLQGALGWFMVESGLVERPSVSHYRLALHLGLALLIYGAVLWSALELVAAPGYGAAETQIRRLRRGAVWLLAPISLTLLSGAFVSGLDAGLVFNTFPLMGGSAVPADWAQLDPWWRNAFDNPVAVQFDHRLLALVTLVSVLTLWLWGFRFRQTRRSRVCLHAVAAAALIQVGLGIATLLAFVPLWLGLAHQAGALLLLTAAIVTVSALRLAPSGGGSA